MKNIFIFSILFFLNLGCQTIPKSFSEQKDTFMHIPSGVLLPRQTKAWSLSNESLTETLSPEILAAASYQFIGIKKDFKPKATIFILKNKTTANVKMIENRVITNLNNPRFNKIENVTLKGKRKIVITSYNHQSNLKEGYGEISVNKEIRAQSLFIQPRKKLQLVFWININRDAKEERATALEFVEDILLNN